MTDNMRIYNIYREPPMDARKAIEGGKLNGFTSINPMWRIQVMTEMCGPHGEPAVKSESEKGWYFKRTNRHVETNMGTDEILATVECELHYNDGTGWKCVETEASAKMVLWEKGKLVLDDECWKKARTDALSVACKYLGIGANIHWADGSKYDELPKPEPKPEKPQPADKINEARAKAMIGYCQKMKIDISKALEPFGATDVSDLTNEQADQFKASLKGAKK